VPKVRETNMVYALERLEPNFPVLDGAWVGETPAEYLPWVALFDHKGERTFADNIRGQGKRLGEALDEAVARAPDFMLGGPYSKLGDIASAIAADRSRIGLQLKKVRSILSGESTDPALLKEAEALLARLEKYSRDRIAKTLEEPDDIVGASRTFKELARIFEGDEIGDHARKLLDMVKADPAFDRCLKAAAALEKARTRFRKLPPAGTYSYNLEYTRTADKAVLDMRKEIITEYRAALNGITKKYPGTFSSGLAKELLSDLEAMLDRDRPL